MQSATNNPPNPEDNLRPHSYDGIQEFDKRLPNWWLLTLYGAMVFSFAYWVYYHWPFSPETTGDRVTRLIAEQKVAAARSSGAALTDDQLWTLSTDRAMVDAGGVIFQSTCASCHQPDLSGKIGPNLKDTIWIHGGNPTNIVATITNGVPAKGMPNWSSVLGKQKITEVAAFILSHHKAGEPMTISPTGK